MIQPVFLTGCIRGRTTENFALLRARPPSTNDSQLIADIDIAVTIDIRVARQNTTASGGSPIADGCQQVIDVHDAIEVDITGTRVVANASVEEVDIHFKMAGNPPRKYFCVFSKFLLTLAPRASLEKRSRCFPWRAHGFEGHECPSGVVQRSLNLILSRGVRSRRHV
jgi:hypothetical protein